MTAEICRRVYRVLIEGLRMLYNIWFTGECHFWTNGCMNKQNMCVWFDKNLYEIEEAQLHLEKLTVWPNFSSHGIIGPVFFTKGRWNPTTNY